MNKKQEIYLGALARMFLQGIVKTEANRVLSDDGSLSEIEKEKCKSEILYFRVVLLLYQLSAIGRFGKTIFNARDIGKMLATAFSLALQDVGASKDEIENNLRQISDRLLTYESYIAQINSEALAKTGIYFNMIRCFSEIVLGKDAKRIMTEEGRDKELTVFDYGKQIFKNDEKALREFVKKVEFQD